MAYTSPPCILSPITCNLKRPEVRKEMSRLFANLRPFVERSLPLLSRHPAVAVVAGAIRGLSLTS